MNNKDYVTLDVIKDASVRLESVAKKTPFEYNTTFSRLSDTSVYLKLENLQRTGSFKLRGAYNCISLLDDAKRSKGVITASAGNHAQGVALGATVAGVKSVIVMPEFAPLSKVEATKEYGADVFQYGTTYDEAYEKALEIQKEKNYTFVHAFDDLDVIAGQGTIGIEMMQQQPDLEAIVIPIGGGGLISGVAAAIKFIAPHVKVYGVQACGAPSSYLSKNAGTRVETKTVDTLADGIAVKTPGEITFRHIERFVDDIFLVKDADIATSMLLLLERSKLVVEGAGATALTAILKNLIPQHKKVGTILSGGNVDTNFISKIIEDGLIKAGRRIKLSTELIDRPGELINFITTIAKNKANIVYIHHERAGKNIPLGYTNVAIDLETRNKQHAEKIIDELEKIGYKIDIVN